MTQALINNLNMTQETTLVSQPKLNSNTDFDKVYNKHVHADKQNTSGKKIIENEKNNTLGSIKKNKLSTSEDLKTVLEQTSKDIIAEAAIDLGLIKDAANKNIDCDNMTTVDINGEIMTETDDLSVNVAENCNEVINDEINQNVTTINTPISQIFANQPLHYDNQGNSSIQNDEDLKVTINGMDIENFINEFEINNPDEEFVVAQPSETNGSDGVKLQDIIEEDKLKELNIEKIDTSVSSGNGESESDLMQNQTPQEQGVKAMLHANTEFQEIKIENTVKPQQTNVSQSTNTNGRIIEQISKQLSNLHNTSRVNIVLNPESLGKVSLQIINNSEGLSAQFTVATQEAKELIMKGLDSLKESLLSHGVNVDNVSVKLNDAQKSEYNQDWTEQEGSRGGNKQHKEHQHSDEKEKDFEQMMFGLTNEEEQV